MSYCSPFQEFAILNVFTFRDSAMGGLWGDKPIMSPMHRKVGVYQRNGLSARYRGTPRYRGIPWVCLGGQLYWIPDLGADVAVYVVGVVGRTKERGSMHDT
jgi:hypothetical protein